MTPSSALMLAARTVRSAHGYDQDSLGLALGGTARETISRRECYPATKRIGVIDEHLSACGGTVAEFVSALCAVVGYTPPVNIEITWEVYRQQLARAAREGDK